MTTALTIVLFLAVLVAGYIGLSMLGLGGPLPDVPSPSFVPASQREAAGMIVAVCLVVLAIVLAIIAFARL